MSLIRVAVAEDHPIVLRGLREALHESEFEIVGSTDRSNEIAPLVEKTQPDVLIMEARLGGKDALKSLEQFVDPNSSPKVIVFSSFVDSSHIARSSALGCYDFIPKSSPVGALAIAVRNAATGVATPDSSLLIRTRTRMRNNALTGDAQLTLTNREMQVLRHVSMGMSNREIGKSLGISVETVKEHVQNILRKLNVNDRTQAAVWAVKRALV